MKDTDRIDTTCMDCQIKMEISYGQYRKSSDKRFRCYDCRKKYTAIRRLDYITNLSPERRKEINDKIGKNSKKYQASLSTEIKQERSLIMVAARLQKMIDDPEFRKNWSNSRKEWYQNQSDHYKEQNVQQAKDWYHSQSDEEKLAYSRKRKEYYSQLSPEAKREYAEIRNWWIGISEEERIAYSRVNQTNSKAYWDGLSHQELEVVKLRQSLNHKSLSDEVKGVIYNALRDGYREFRDNLTDEDRRKLFQKTVLGSQGTNKLHRQFENAFTNVMESSQYYFKKEESLSHNNVTHSWDYGIYQKDSDTLVMVVDLDGAFFHADKNDYNGLHSREEYDEIRLQSIPDGIKYNIILELKFKDSFSRMMKDLECDFEEFIKEQFLICRRIPYPQPIYSNKELWNSWEQLLRLDPSSQYLKLSTRNQEGDRIIRHFHPSIYRANKKGSFSPYQAWYDDKLLKKVIRNRSIYINTLNPNKILQGFTISRIAPRVSVFSAGRAKLLIYRYLSEYDTIFDPFSGFSGRMLGCVSSGKHYIGQDISPIHVNESNRVIEDLSIQDRATVTVGNCLASIGVYDCLFTCPPYGDKEQWLDVPVSKKSCDDWIEICLDNFKCEKYLFVVDNTNRYKDHVVDVIVNKSHFGNNDEYVILI